MTLANRTALAAGLCGLLAVVLAAVTASLLFARSLSERVDDQLRDRAVAAPVLAAVGDRIEVSELTVVVDGARVITPARTVDLGATPRPRLPLPDEPGLRTVRNGGESWRLLAVEVRDVPDPGDEAIVEFIEPLGDVTAQIRQVRRRIAVVGLIAAGLVTLIGLVAGRRAAKPLTDLATSVRRIDHHRPTDWQVDVDTSTPEVREIAGALNESLGQLAIESHRRQEALEAARSFAAAASHELRNPLQSALLNLDLAIGDDPDPRVESARTELARMRSSLDAVRQLSEVDLVDRRSFEEADLVEIVDQAIGTIGAGSAIELRCPDRCRHTMWADGVRLAVENLLRNAIVHGRPVDGASETIIVTVTPEATIVVDDNGPGIAPADRTRILEPFERSAGAGPGSGLGLAFVARVAALHAGTVEVSDSPLGGARIVVALGPGPRPVPPSTPLPGSLDPR